MDSLTRSVFSVMKFRLRAIEQYNKRAIEVQHRQFARIMRILNKTEYGHRYAPSLIRDYTSFANKIPVVEYEDIRGDVERMLRGEQNILLRGHCKWFAQSSGTSGGRSKFLPVSGLHLQSAHYRGGGDAVWLYLSSRTDSQFFKHKGLILGGSHHASSIYPGVNVGDLSAILIENMPTFGRFFQVPNKEILLMDEWVSKMNAIINSVKKTDVGSISGVPSWMLEMIMALLTSEGKEDLSLVWPHLEVFFHGGISFAPYREKFKQLISSDRMQYRETYNASEGFFGIQNDPSDNSLLLMLDYGIFYEFIPFSEIESEYPNVVPLEGVEVGVNYAILISTLGGLYRYMIGDTVQFTSRNPYKFIITGRTQHFINAFGEELMVCNANDALRKVSAEMGIHILEYTVAPHFKLDEAKGYHEWLIEFEEVPVDLQVFEHRLDEELRKINSDYDAKRYADMALENLRVIPVRKDLFRDWLANKGKLGGQHKVPRMKNNRDLLEEILSLNEQRNS